MFGNYYSGYTPGYYNPMQNDPFGKMSLPQTGAPAPTAAPQAAYSGYRARWARRASRWRPETALF
jgi:hypothetical protein